MEVGTTAESTEAEIDKDEYKAQMAPMIIDILSYIYEIYNWGFPEPKFYIHRPNEKIRL